MHKIVCIDVEHKNDGYTVIRLSDKYGLFSSYCGAGLSAFILFERDENIQLSREVYPL
jgi:hypothetical protein